MLTNCPSSSSNNNILLCSIVYQSLFLLRLNGWNVLNSNRIVFAYNLSLFHAVGRNDWNKITIYAKNSGPKCTRMQNFVLLQCHFIGSDTPGHLCERRRPHRTHPQPKTGASSPYYLTVGGRPACLRLWVSAIQRRCSSLQWIPPIMNPGSSGPSLKWIHILLRLGLNGPPFIWAYTEKNPIRADKSPRQHSFITQH